MTDFEKLGVFYLGREFDAASGNATEVPLLYDAKDLTTHALCVGMTGSGKTGLCVSLLEEAAIDAIPAIVIDPKGDLANMMLAFPDLRPEDFAPWVDPAEAGRQGIAPEALAAKTAQVWREGLAAWGQTPERIARFRDAADAAIYTPGSQAGLPVSVLKSFAAPPPKLREDPEVLRERITGATSGLLALLGIDADPLQSREHMLLANILETEWRGGRDASIADLIRLIQTPPFDRLGVLDLESFYPGKDRASLAMRLNGLLASPGFAVWTQGEPLDIQRILYTPEGKPRISIFSIAHLSDAERMFFVTLLLNETIAWMRNQPGTSSLRAILYMDEIFGFFPPTANPPSKGPMLTLLKQARAFGVGCVLATQNPVDLDYKGLSNCGTWFLGRLQTERDKARILDGLEGATQGAGRAFDRSTIDKMLSGLGKRVFLMNNVHDNAPALFQTRWALSFLGGPMTRAQIEKIMAPRKATMPAPQVAPVAEATRASASATLPPVPGDIPQTYLLSDRSAAEVELRPTLLAEAKLHFVSAAANIDEWATYHAILDVPDRPEDADWDQGDLRDGPAPQGQPTPPPGARFADLPACALQPKNFASWAKSLGQYLYQQRKFTLLRCPALKLTSHPGESDGDFRVRIREALRGERDQAVEELRKRHVAKLAPLESKIRTAEGRVAKEASEYQEAKMQSMLSTGASVLGALLGTRRLTVTKIRSVGTAMGRMSRAGKQRDDIGRAKESLDALQGQRADLEAEFAEKMAQLQAAPDESDVLIEEISLPPRKSDIAVEPLRLAWVPITR
jgi:hypothetical protein